MGPQSLKYGEQAALVLECAVAATVFLETQVVMLRKQLHKPQDKLFVVLLVNRVETKVTCALEVAQTHRV